MAVEAKRGCGFRKIGGTYLAGGGIGVPCDRLPLPLDVCPTCSHGIKPARGWTWVDTGALVQGPHNVLDTQGLLDHCPESERCVFCGRPETIGRAGLLWIGEQFYATPHDFVAEGVALGFSRRIKAVPKGFKVGETWVLLAHKKAVEESKASFENAGNFHDSMLPPSESETIYKPGLFYVWLPQRIERIMPESLEGSDEAKALVKRGITPVFVPDNEPDHGGDSQNKLFEEE